MHSVPDNSNSNSKFVCFKLVQCRRRAAFFPAVAGTAIFVARFAPAALDHSSFKLLAKCQATSSKQCGPVLVKATESIVPSVPFDFVVTFCAFGTALKVLTLHSWHMFSCFRFVLPAGDEHAYFASDASGRGVGAENMK